MRFLEIIKFPDVIKTECHKDESKSMKQEVFLLLTSLVPNIFGQTRKYIKSRIYVNKEILMIWDIKNKFYDEVKLKTWRQKKCNQIHDIKA